MKKRGILQFGIILLIIVLPFAFTLEEKVNPEVNYEINKLDNNQKLDVILRVSDNESFNASSEEIYKDYVYTEVTKQELNELKDDPNVKNIFPNLEIKAFLTESVPQVNATLTQGLQVNGINLTGINQTVCVIDSGVNFSHGDLYGKNLSCVIDCYNKLCVENCSIGDDNSHGTHVAGIVAASGGITGVSTGVRILAVKILGSNGLGSGNSFDLSRAIDYCSSRNVTVITMSLGTDSDYDEDCAPSMSHWTTAINSAYAKNISIIAAAGNEVNTMNISSPACIANVTAVGSIQKNDASIDYSRNSLVKLIAPGVSISSTGYNGGYIIKSGTSMATPHVAGAFAIIQEFINITNQYKRPKEIEDILNSTGKKVYDSSSGSNFTRIDIYSAILSIDNIPPNVTLISPLDNQPNISLNQSFNCSFSDFQLNNVTFELWNSSKTLIYNETKPISGNNNHSSFNLSNLNYESYEWNCKASDLKNNYAYSSNNFTLVIYSISTSLVSPINSAYINNESINFTCESDSVDDYNLTNVSLFIWDITDTLIYNETKNITGTTNESSFNYTINEDGNYSWNCKSFNNHSEFRSYSENYSFILDTIDPIIYRIESSVLTDSATIKINSTEEVNMTINHGTTSILGTISHNSSYNNSSTITISGLTSSTVYYFNITSCDRANNCIINSSSLTTSSLSVQENPGGGGGGGGGGLYVGKIYNIDHIIGKRGYTKELQEKDRINFVLINSINHSLTLNKIYPDSINITLKSNTQYKILYIGAEQSIDLDFDNYFDITIRLISIVNNKAKINLTILNESKPTDNLYTDIGDIKAMEKSKSEPENPLLNTDKNYPEKHKINIKAIIFVLIIGFIAFIFIIFIKISRKRNKRDKHLSIYRENFQKQINLNSLKGKTKNEANKTIT